jgi:hypothetical protein
LFIEIDELLMRPWRGLDELLMFLFQGQGQALPLQIF